MGVAPYSDAALEREAAIVRGGRLRALWLWSALACGIGIAPITHETTIPIGIFGSAWGFGLAAACLVIALLTRAWTCRVAVTLGLICLGWSFYTLRAVEVPATSLAPTIAPRSAASPTQSTIITLRARVLETPRTVPSRQSPLGTLGFLKPVTRFSVAAMNVQEDPLRTVSGTFWVRIDDGTIPEIQAGDEVLITGSAKPLLGPTNPGEFDLATWGIVHNVAGALTLSNQSLITPLPANTAPLARILRSVTRGHASLRDRAQLALTDATRTTPEPARSMVHSLILGETPRDDTLSSAFLRLGLAHVLAISGFHLIVMSRLALFLIRLTGDRGAVEPLAVATAVIFYMLIVPPGAPVLRSGFLAIALLTADALGRRFDRAVILILISTLLLIIDPLDLWSLGYQLSCGLTLLLVCCGSAATENLFGITLRGIAPQRITLFGWGWRTFKSSLAALTGSTLLCWLGSLPLILFRTGLVSPLTLIATILIVPPITLLLWLAFLALGLGLLVPSAATISAPLLSLSARGIAWLVTMLDGLPLTSMRFTRPDALWMIAATVVALMWLVRGRLRQPRYWASLGLLAIWYAAHWASVHVLPYRNTPAKIDMLDVGDGSCILIRAERTTVLWDAGSLRPGLGADTISRALTQLNVPKLDAIFITHPDVDHFGGVPELLRTFQTPRIITSPRLMAQATEDPASAAASLIRIITASPSAPSIETAHGEQVLHIGPLRWKLLSPPALTPAWDNDNEHSLVAELSAATGPIMLLTGDAGPQAIAAILAARTSPTASGTPILELPHHGSFNPQAETLVRRTDPGLILQSTGPRRLGNPSWDATRQTLAGPRPWLITARDGAIWVDVSRDRSLRSGSMLGREMRK